MNQKTKLTRKEAFELSIEKWKMIVKANGKYLQEIRNKFGHLEGECGLCEKYNNTQTTTLIDCAKCPIRPKIKDYDDIYSAGCLQKTHPFTKYWVNKTKENAQLVLDLIKSKQ